MSPEEKFVEWYKNERITGDPAKARPYAALATDIKKWFAAFAHKQVAEGKSVANVCL